jgi:hypothetical protein
MAWDFCAWVGIAVLTALALRLLREAIVSFIVVRIGWTKLEELGFWRSLWPAFVKRRCASATPTCTPTRSVHR